MRSSAGSDKRGLRHPQEVPRNTKGIYYETENEREFWKGPRKKPRRVIGIQAAPRKKKGSTEMIFAPFLRGMADAGASVTAVHLGDLNIYPCAGCFRCWLEESGRCPLDDDMQSLVDTIPDYDLMVLATPLYVDGMSGLLKNFIDRLMPLDHPSIFVRDKQCLHPARVVRLPNLVLMSVCGFYEIANFSPLVRHIGAIARNMHMPLVTTLLRPESLSLKNPAAFARFGKVTEALEVAGKEVVETGAVSKRTLQAISQPLLAKEQYLEIGKAWFVKDTRS